MHPGQVNPHIHPQVPFESVLLQQLQPRQRIKNKEKTTLIAQVPCLEQIPLKLVALICWSISKSLPVTIWSAIAAAPPSNEAAVCKDVQLDMYHLLKYRQSQQERLSPDVKKKTIQVQPVRPPHECNIYSALYYCSAFWRLAHHVMQAQCTEFHLNW